MHTIRPFMAHLLEIKIWEKFAAYCFIHFHSVYRSPICTFKWMRIVEKIVSSVQSVTNIFEYSNIQIFLIQTFIQIFVRIIFWIRIYSDIRSCQLFGYEYIRIFVRSKILIRIYSNICLNPFSDSNNVFCLISMDITLCSWIFCR